ncbi:heavy metal translocating P-type ATPase [Xanthobacter sp. KR7-225]|uniref:heavy metal translocating P-type ATPase n=1 Tax=Xanthobacter sp. KR7-225 TaxID=3156613 RepID=UPI0032B56AFA
MNAPQVLSRFRVSGLDCAACAAKIEGAAKRVDGITEISVSVAAATLAVRHVEGLDLSALADRLSPMGYTLAPLPAAAGPDAAPGAAPACSGAGAHGHDHDRDHAAAPGPGEAAPADRRWWAAPKTRLTLASGAALVAAFGAAWVVPQARAEIFVVAMLVGLVPIARRAFAAARNGMPFTIEMLMTIAAVGAVVIGAAEEAAAVVFLFLVGELLEGVAAGRARAGIRALAALVPKTALLERAGAAVEVPAERLPIGAVILVRPGERIAADGVVLAGASGVDESPVTGESAPVAKGPDAPVFAGTVNGEAALRIRVTAAAQDNTIARVVRLVEEAQEARAPTERFIDRFARHYTPAVVAVAALVAVVPPLAVGAGWDEWIYKGLAILLIGCPCALVISTPAAIAAGLAAGARRGLLMKGGAVLETARQVSVVCFDKTGTLTAGKPQVTDIVAVSRPEAEILALAAALEAGSSHPLASAILARAAADGIAPAPAEAARALSGKGVSGLVDGREVLLLSPRAAAALAPLGAEPEARIAALAAAGKTCAVVVADGRLAGLIALRDEPRADAKAGIAALTRKGIRTLMLTGDNRATGDAIGAALGIDVRAELMPQDKLAIVGALKRAGAVVANVGDGINDAPALAAADIGIAMGGGTDVALETADAAVLHGRVTDVAAMIDLSRRTMGNIHQNIAIALGLKAVFLVTTLAGITGLWPAILADTGATVLVTLNALRLLSARPG